MSQEEIPTVPSTSGMARWHHRTDSQDWGECRECDIEFDSHEALDDHMATEHPKRCMEYGCENMAAYRRGARFSTGYICANCLKSYPNPKPLTSWIWLTNEANIDAPTLPDDHPIEETLRGLYGSRERAQEEESG